MLKEYPGEGRSEGLGIVGEGEGVVEVGSPHSFLLQNTRNKHLVFVEAEL